MVYGNQNAFTINGIPYPVATSQQGMEWILVENGDVLEKKWTDWSGGMGYTEAVPGIENGFHYATGIDTTTYGRFRKPPLNTTLGAKDAAATDVCWLFEVADGGGTKYVYVVQGAKAHKYSFDGATRHETLTFAGLAGRPAYFNGAWYVPFGDSNAAKKLTVPVNTPPTSDSTKWADVNGAPAWRAIALTTFQDGATPKLARGYSTNQIALSAATGDVTAASWTDGSRVGDLSTKITDMIEAQGMLYIGKEDNLYEYDADGIARPIIPGLSRSNVDTLNGIGMHSFGDIVFYPCVNGLWRYKIGYGALPIGLDANRFFTAPTGTASIAAPLHSRPRNVVSDGAWIYALTDTVAGSPATSYLLAGRFRQENEPNGPEIIWHIINTGLITKGLFIDSAHKLWMFSSMVAGTAAGQWVQLGTDGSVEGSTRDTGTAYTLYLSEEDFGLPFVAKNQIDITLDINTSGTVSVDIRQMADGAAETSFGPAVTITTGGRQKVVENQPSYFYKIRPIIRLNSTHVADIYAIRMRCQRPSTFRVLIPTDKEALGMYGTDEATVYTNLELLIDSGPHTIEAPGQLNFSSGVVNDKWTAYVRGIKHTTYINESGTPARALEVIIDRYIQRVATT